MFFFIRILAKRSGLNWRENTRFATLQRTLDLNLDQFEHLVKTMLAKKLYTRLALLDEFGITDDDFDYVFLSENTKHLDSFKLRQRALHVIQGN